MIRYSSGNSEKSERFSPKKKRLLLAFAVAAISDALSAGLTFIPPIEWGIDIVTALLLFLILGRQWLILPGLIAEAIPGLAIFPFWILVVGSIALWGTVRRAPPQPQQQVLPETSALPPRLTKQEDTLR
jgi:hypothetical protein